MRRLYHQPRVAIAPFRRIRHTLQMLAALVLLVGGHPAAQAEALGTLTLEQALTLGLQQNVGLALSRQEVQSAQLEVTQARSSFLPAVDAQLSLSEGLLASSTTGTLTPQASATLSSSLALYTGGSRKATLEASQLTLSGEEATQRRAQEALVLEIVTEYLEAVSRAALLRVEEENLASQEKLEAQIRAFFQAGKRPISDLYQQQALTRSAELAVIRAQRDLSVARLELLQTLGCSPTDTFEGVEPDLSSLSSGIEQKSLEALLPEALEHRLDLSAQREGTRRAAARVQGARAGYLPTVAAFASLGGSGQGDAHSLYRDTGRASGTAASEVSAAEDGSVRLDASVGLTVSLPVFDRHQTRTAVASAELERRRQALILTQLQQSIAVALGQALEEYREAAKRMEVTAAQLTVAQQALEATQARYDVGASTLVELTQARVSWVEASSEQVRGRYAVAQRAVAVLYQQGRLLEVFSLNS